MRIGLGLGALALPRLVGRIWVGTDADRPGTALLLRSAGGRDLGLGIGTVLAYLAGRPVRPWAIAGVISDTGDTLATLGAYRDLPRVSRVLVLTLSAAAALSGVAGASRLERP
jgi:hypothetical protein